MDDQASDNPAAEQDPSSPAEEILQQAILEIRRVEPRAFLVEARVLRRVIKAEVDLPALTMHVPHRKSWLVKRNTLIKHVELDELGAEPLAELPEPAILLQRPDEEFVAEMGLEAVLLRSWRLLYHARIDLAFRQMYETGWLDQAAIRARVDRLGQVEFDEVCAVLRHEQMTQAGASVPELFAEFAAVYGELRAFAPHCLPAYFPSLQDPGRVEELLFRDVELDRMLAETRPARAPAAISTEDRAAHDETDAELDHLTGRPTSIRTAPSTTEQVQLVVEPAARQHPGYVRRLQRRAERAASRGNSVAAALAQVSAAKRAPEAEATALTAGALAHIQRLVERLQVALELDEAVALRWYPSLVGLARNAGRGFWNADKRLLHDLQRVCVDHEREIHEVDLLRWLRSFGRAPLKHTLPNQREVLMSKHLASATRWLVTSRLTGAERDELSYLLRAAADSAEQQMRRRLRPLLSTTLQGEGLVPSSTPERVAFDKTLDELLDRVVQKGFLTVGDLRDSISSSHLKLDDLPGPREFLFGDRLLRADKALSRSIDGVYQRSDFYLRWLQRATSLSFGTAAGRFLTRFVFLPFGAAYLIFAALIHVGEIFASEGSLTLHWLQVHTLEIVAGLGGLGLLLFHVDAVRKALWRGLKALFVPLRRILWDWPVRLFRFQFVRRILRSSPVVALRKFVLWPLVPTALICYVLPRITSAMPQQTVVNWGVVLLAMSVILNSRVGRDVEELGQEWLYTTWRRIRVNVFVALFDAIMGSFKQMLEIFERLLYAVDEWLRFKSGETALALGIKAVLGVFWTVFTFVARFVVNLLVEPQVNPIKHFPVVTVGHKLLLPMAPKMITLLAGFDAFNIEEATAVVTPTIFLIPGIFGFIAWELKSNWYLYKANASKTMQAATVGTHGETFIRLMKPGFHSGTLPKLFRRLRRIDRNRRAAQHSLARSRTLAKMHQVHLAVTRFTERELLAQLHDLPGWETPVHVESVRLASNSVRVDLGAYTVGPEPLQLLFEEQSGWLLASVRDAGWAKRLEFDHSSLLIDALSGFYRLAGVDIVREQVDAAFGPNTLPYDVIEDGFVVWPDTSYSAEAEYNLHKGSNVRPTPRSVARTYDLPALSRDMLVFSHTPVTWRSWEERWESNAAEPPPCYPQWHAGPSVPANQLRRSTSPLRTPSRVTRPDST